VLAYKNSFYRVKKQRVGAQVAERSRQSDAIPLLANPWTSKGKISPSIMLLVAVMAYPKEKSVDAILNPFAKETLHIHHDATPLLLRVHCL
jgi:hypothetical protein